VPAKDSAASWFQSICLRNAVKVASVQLELLEKYVAVLLEWNQRVNLISRKDEQKVWERHILHSVSLLFRFSVIGNAKVMDLGTGGGLPGIPIKILIPALSLTLVDSIKTKTQAVADIVHQLSLTDVDVKCGRAEDLGRRMEFRNQFDYIISRGVADLKRLIEWSYPLVKSPRYKSIDTAATEPKALINPGALIALKGGNLEREITPARKTKYVDEISVIDLRLESLDQSQNPHRKVVIVHFQ
jgi:16S rRNA (guanine527-N7)-methyltransferase